ncbi:hypothetical protein Tco_0783489 [Tanacetum coccineum]
MFWREREAISWIMMGMGGDDGLGGGNDNEATNENVHEDAPLDVEANNEATVITEGSGVRVNTEAQAHDTPINAIGQLLLMLPVCRDMLLHLATPTERAYHEQLSDRQALQRAWLNLGTHAVSSGCPPEQEILRIEMTLLHHLPGTSSTPCAEWFGTPSMSDRGQVVECNSGKFEADSLAIEVDRFLNLLKKDYM